MKKEEIDGFLDKVDEVHESINKIIDGKLSEEEYNDLEKRINRDKYIQMDKAKK